jgi:hypothetical protein
MLPWTSAEKNIEWPRGFGCPNKTAKLIPMR